MKILILNGSPRTGDDRNEMLWFALLAVGMGGVGYAWRSLRRE